MYIYNVSIKLIPTIETEWLRWMKEEHMNEVLNTGMFDDAQLFELLEPKDEEESKTYIAQYITDSEERYTTYIEKFAPALREKGYEKFGNQFIAFRSIMKKSQLAESHDYKGFQKIQMLINCANPLAVTVSAKIKFWNLAKRSNLAALNIIIKL